MNKYKLQSATNNNAILKKKDYNFTLFIILLIFIFIIGIIYYLVADDLMVNIQVNPSMAGQSSPNMDPNFIPMNMGNTNTPVPVNNVPANPSDNNFCPECGTQLNSNDKFCPKCGKKI